MVGILLMARDNLCISSIHHFTHRDAKKRLSTDLTEGNLTITKESCKTSHQVYFSYCDEVVYLGLIFVFLLVRGCS